MNKNYGIIVLPLYQYWGLILCEEHYTLDWLLGRITFQKEGIKECLGTIAETSLYSSYEQ